MPNKLKFPLAVLALSLFPLGKACAIGITINPTTYMSSTAVGLALPLVEDIYQPTSSDPFAVSTSAVSGVSISNATWSFVNTNASAIFSGNFFLSAFRNRRIHDRDPRLYPLRLCAHKVGDLFDFRQFELEHLQ